MKAYRVCILFISVMLLFLCVSISTAQALTHPCLIFNNITETPGYQHRTEEPWSDWESDIISSADRGLSKNFSDPNWRVVYQAEKAIDLALAYQITKDTTYANKAKEALLNMDIGDFAYDVSYAWAVQGYSLCYDWVQPYLNSTEDEIVRDKLATLADELYYRLNDGGTNPDYIAFADFHGKAYPTMGIVGCVLSDYTNPNNLSLNSTPSDWFRVGTHDLFVNDTMHSWSKSLIGVVCDGSGKYSQGNYKDYWDEDMAWWLQVYSHFNGSNIFDVYPMAKKIMINELWDTLPNRYSANYGTLGNVKWFVVKEVINLLNSEEISYALNYLDELENTDILPYSRFWSVNNRLLYLIYDDYSSVERKNPSWTSHFDPTSFYQVFRASWQNDSDWLSLITWPEGFETQSNRNMAHHDQLSFEYYSRGDLLLADGGEDKHVLDYYYGGLDIYHNTILIEDPRTPFENAYWSDSRARGVFKGSEAGLFTPSYIKNMINTTWMESVDVNATIKEVVKPMSLYGIDLSSPIEYERNVIYPEKDYFAIIDRLEGNESWIYRNVFRPTSLNITPTAMESNYTDMQINASAGIHEASHTVSFDSIDGKSFELYTRFVSPNTSGVMNVYVNDNYVGNISFTNETAYYRIRDISSTYLTTGVNTIKYNTTDSVILTIDFTTITNMGNVRINLSINNTYYDWLSLPYKNETPTGITTNSIRWNTTNPYGNEVNMHLFSSPASEIIVTKHVTRIAGYGSKSEVFLPLVYFRSNETNDLYRVTVLLSRYPTEEEKIPENIAVTGNGTAVKVTSPDYEDFIYTGNGTSSFANISTDAYTLYFRNATNKTITIINGSYVNYNSLPQISTSNIIDYLTIKYKNDNRTFRIKGDGSVNITLYNLNSSATYRVERDGVLYTSWVITNGNMTITTDLSEHTFEVYTYEAPTPTHRHPYISRPFIIAGGSAALAAIAMWIYRRRRKRLRRGFFMIFPLVCVLFTYK